MGIVDMRYKYEGVRYSRLKIITLYANERQPNYPYGWKYRALCKCDCDNIVDVSLAALQSRNTQSCGCYRDDRIREEIALDLTGQQFRNWVVVRDVGVRGKLSQRAWLCKCIDCGKEKVFRAGDISREMEYGNHLKECQHRKGKPNANKKDNRKI